jgi:hypothetical protein
MIGGYIIGIARFQENEAPAVITQVFKQTFSENKE